jgi:nicotinate-nucleotide pyrophosphorylase (carboxylating)
MENNIINRLISSAIDEDIPWGDITSDYLINKKDENELIFNVRDEGIIAGLPIAHKVFKTIDHNITWINLVNDGDFVEKGDVIAKVRGNSIALLKAERTALNFLQRLSGIATLTRKYVDLARTKSEIVRIVDTRKTTPGLRYLEKYAVRIGGGYNHRYSLSDAVLIKSHHLEILYEQGMTIKRAVDKLKSQISHTVIVEVEINDLEDLSDALRSKADIVLLSNMDVDQLKLAVKKNNSLKKLEASGGINLENVVDIAETGIDYISIGSLTHSAPALDISFDFVPIREELFTYGVTTDEE